MKKFALIIASIVIVILLLIKCKNEPEVLKRGVVTSIYKDYPCHCNIVFYTGGGLDTAKEKYYCTDHINTFVNVGDSIVQKGDTLIIKNAQGEQKFYAQSGYM